MLPPFHTPHSTMSQGTERLTTYRTLSQSAKTRSLVVIVNGATRRIISMSARSKSGGNSTPEACSIRATLYPKPETTRLIACFTILSMDSDVRDHPPQILPMDCPPRAIKLMHDFSVVDDFKSRVVHDNVVGGCHHGLIQPRVTVVAAGR